MAENNNLFRDAVKIPERDRKDELQTIMNACKFTKTDYDDYKGIFGTFLERVIQSSNEIVVIDDALGIELSYKQLYNLVKQMEEQLLKRHVTKGIKVGINLERSYISLVTILTLCKLGAVIVPLDKSYPERYISHIIEDAQIDYLISDEKNNFKHTINLSEIDFHTGEEELKYEDLTQKLPNGESNNDDLRFIYYTSGSTGKPKGVKHTEKHVLYELLWRSKNYPLKKTDVVGQRAPLNVVLSLMDFLHGVLMGTKTVILPTSVLVDPNNFAKKIKSYKISIMVLPESIISLLSLPLEDDNDLSSLNTIITAGELFKKNTFKQFNAKFPHIKFVDIYGSTEMLSILCKEIDRIAGFDQGWKKVDNLNAYIMDEENNILPFDQIGELCVSGIFTENNGYYALGQEQNAKFFSWVNPLTRQVEKMYRTGDLAHLAKDGTYHLIGRKDSLVKINARLVNLKRVESVISEIPYVKDVAVLLKRTSKVYDVSSLEAFVETTENRIDKSMILTFLKEQLPSYMIPKQIYFMAQLPKLPNGKTDYKRLESEAIPPKAAKLDQTSILAILQDFIGEDISENSDVEFIDLGLDSITITKFAFSLKEALGVNISPSDIYNYPTIKKLSAYIQTMNKTVRHNRNYEKNKNSTSDIGVIGMSGVFPDAGNINQFWENLCAGKDSVTEIPKERWSLSGFYDVEQGKHKYSNSKWGAFLQDIESFDADFFNISDKEAVMMDPQQRICLRESYNALIDSGYDKNSTKNIGVFIGASNHDYDEKISQENIKNSHGVLGTDHSMLAARIAYFNDFNGPALTVNTACSSSLVALHLARQSLLLHECDVALVGGVNIINSPTFYKNTSLLGVFSPTGKCKTFAEDADGFVPGEGAGFLVLKRYEDLTPDDMENMYAVIKGTAVNQDGRTNGITAPNGISQLNLYERVCDRTGILPSDISYLETHGTGTKLGDLIELEAIQQLFEKYETPLEHTCDVSSVKTNIGHLIGAAGVVGLIKAILCVTNRMLVPSLHCSEPNKLFPWDRSNLNITKSLKPWDKKTLLAGVSSYGIGGTNAFCIIQEPDRKEKRRPTKTYTFNEKKYAIMADEVSHDEDNSSINFATLLKSLFNNAELDNKLTLIENGIDSLKIIDLKNMINEKNIEVSLDDLMNKSIENLINEIRFDQEDEVRVEQKKNNLFANIEDMSTEEMKKILNKFS